MNRANTAYWRAGAIIRAEIARLEGLVSEKDAILERIKQTCLFVNDDGTIGVTNDPHIHDELFADICKSLSPNEGTK